MRRAVALAVVLLVVLAGCGETAEPPESAGGDTFADPPSDRLGWEGGYWHNESIAVDASDGLNDSEFAKVKARAMARVELLRTQEFSRDVAFEFVTRERFREDTSFGGSYRLLRDQYWEAAHVVGEDTTAAAEFRQLYDVVVDGYYDGRTVVMVVDDPDSPSVDPGTLAHELSHALPGPRFDGDVGAPRTTYDEQQALRAVDEGAADLVERRYLSRCGEAWSCIDPPEGYTVPAGAGDVNRGLYVQFAFRYTAGSAFAERAMLSDSGLTVERLQGPPPTSTEQVIHPGRYPDDAPTRVRVRDRSAEDWTRRTPDGRASMRLGEATLYTMLWYNGVIPGKSVEITQGQQVDLNYSHPATTGWAGDALVVYRAGNRTGYVFESVWDTERDAREFEAAYLELLRSKGATEVRENVYVVESGRFADAFRVVQRGDTLLVVNAPTVAALEDVHAPE